MLMSGKTVIIVCVGGEGDNFQLQIEKLVGSREHRLNQFSVFYACSG